MDRQRFPGGVVQHGAAASVDLCEFRMKPALLVGPVKNLAGIARVVADHREGPVVIIRHDDAAQLPVRHRVIGIQCQNLHLIMIEIDGIIVGPVKGYSHEAVFVVAVGTDRHGMEDIGGQLFGGLGKSLPHGKDHLHSPFPGVDILAVHIGGQGRQGRGIGHQDLDPLPADAVADRLQRRVAHVGNINHFQIVLEGFPG